VGPLSGRVSPPRPLSEAHRFDDFRCGEPSLDEWLRRRALANQVSGASRTFVVCSDGERIVGFYSLATATVSHAQATGALRRNMPDPVPMIMLARLAVDQSHQRMGLGEALLRDAQLRALQVADHVGVRGLLVHALSDDARAFYERWGFSPSAADPLLLMMRMTDIVATVSASNAR
jgi:predicted N-acetyltransferase YhbS